MQFMFENLKRVVPASDKHDKEYAGIRKSRWLFSKLGQMTLDARQHKPVGKSVCFEGTILPAGYLRSGTYANKTEPEVTPEPEKSVTLYDYNEVESEINPENDAALPISLPVDKVPSVGLANESSEPSGMHDIPKEARGIAAFFRIGARYHKGLLEGQQRSAAAAPSQQPPTPQS